MTRDEFLKRVNQRTTKRYGVRVTSPMLRNWVVEELVPKAVPRGRRRAINPDWQWNCRHYRRVLQICRIKSYGIKRVTAIRNELWLNGIDIPFDLLREAILKEFKWDRKRLLKPVTSEFDPRGNKPLSSKKQKMINKQMGELSHLLPCFELSDADKIMMLQKANIGISEINSTDLVRKAINQMGIIKNVEELKDIEMAINNGIIGLLGDSEQIYNSAEDTIKNADQATFNMARELSRNNLQSLHRQVKAPNIKYGPWRLNNFVWFLNMVHRNSNADKSAK